MASSKRKGIKSSAQDNFLEPNAVTGLSASNVGTSRPYLATGNTVSAANAAGTGGAATLSWTLPPASPPATSYTITTTPATYSAVTENANTSYTFEGLGSEISYTFTVVATNAAGSSVSTTSGPVTITTVPQAPTGASVTSAVANQDSVQWNAPATGGLAITSYTVTSSDSAQNAPRTNATSPSVFTEVGGTSQSYTIVAINANGTSAGASTGSITTLPPFFPPFFPPYFPPFFPPFFPPYFPPFFPPYFPPFFPPFFPPYFPPYFVPPFFPPFFPPYFPPYFVPPFFPPYFVPPYFVPPFFPPYFVPPSFGACNPPGACTYSNCTKMGGYCGCACLYCCAY